MSKISILSFDFLEAHEYVSKDIFASGSYILGS